MCKNRINSSNKTFEIPNILDRILASRQTLKNSQFCTPSGKQGPPPFLEIPECSVTIGAFPTISVLTLCQDGLPGMQVVHDVETSPNKRMRLGDFAWGILNFMCWGGGGGKKAKKPTGRLYSILF